MLHNNSRTIQVGFTIVELLIVVIVIAILATIAIFSYTGVRNNATNAKRDSDIALYHKTILIARTLTGKTLKDITDYHFSAGVCAMPDSNPDGIEPRDLPKNHICWLRYYNNIEVIGAAAGVNLDSLKSGDSRGNPYVIDENEGENCDKDLIYSFDGSGVAATLRVSIDRLRPC